MAAGSGDVSGGGKTNIVNRLSAAIFFNVSSCTGILRRSCSTVRSRADAKYRIQRSPARDSTVMVFPAAVETE